MNPYRPRYLGPWTIAALECAALVFLFASLFALALVGPDFFAALGMVR